MFKKRHPPVGARPGTLVIEENTEPTSLRVMHYTPDQLEEREIEGPAELDALLEKEGVCWIDVRGLGTRSVLEHSARFEIHPLALEDVVNVPQRPKTEEYPGHQLFITHIARQEPEHAAGLFNTYLSVVSQRTNDVMKVLTIMASIFIPLTFMAGIYGMNFDTMPELHAKWGYPILLGVMALTTLGMIWFFRRRGWIGSRRAD